MQLTPNQQTAIQNILATLWNNPRYICPAILSLKPQHGYKSRVFKDTFSPDQYAVWMELGCSNQASAGTDRDGRPRLTFGPHLDYPNYTYTLVVPIRSDFHGSVYVDDVFPDGLPARATK